MYSSIISYKKKYTTVLNSSTSGVRVRFGLCKTLKKMNHTNFYWWVSSMHLHRSQTPILNHIATYMQSNSASCYYSHLFIFYLTCCIDDAWFASCTCSIFLPSENFQGKREKGKRDRERKREKEKKTFKRGPDNAWQNGLKSLFFS